MNWKLMLVYFFIGYAALTVLIDLVAPSIMYRPPRPSYEANQGTIVLITADSVKIAANYYPNDAAQYTILYCNGNMADLGLVKPLMEYFRDQGFSIFVFDYHGYGLSGGIPSEKTTYLDAQAAYDYLVNTLKVPPKRIIVYGKSLGAGVALQLSITHPVAGLVIESPFVSAYRTYTQVRLFLNDKYRNLAKIKQLTSPLLVIHGRSDAVIPFWQGKKLYEQASVPKVNLWVLDAGHNNVMNVAQNAYWQAWKRLITLIEANGAD